MAPPHRFTRAADGTSLAYRVVGEGPAIVFTNGFACSDYYWKHMARHFQQFSTIVTWDLKGHGRSSGARDLDAATIPDSADDLRRVMDAAGIESATLVGFSLGCQVNFEAWRQFPDRIDAFVPILGTYGRPADALLHPLVGRQLHRIFRRVGPPAAPVLIGGAYLSMRSPLAHWMNQAFGMIGKQVGRSTMMPFYDHFALIHPKTWVALGINAQDHTAEDILPSIDVPTLIVAGGRDALTPARVSQHMHDAIPTAEMLMLPQATHAGLFEYSDEIIHAVDAFLRSNAIIGPSVKAKSAPVGESKRDRASRK